MHNAVTMSNETHVREKEMRRAYIEYTVKKVSPNWCPIDCSRSLCLHKSRICITKFDTKSKYFQTYQSDKWQWTLFQLAFGLGFIVFAACVFCVCSFYYLFNWISFPCVKYVWLNTETVALQWRQQRTDGDRYSRHLHRAVQYNFLFKINARCQWHSSKYKCE